MTRRAVVLMNLGGPDSPEAVRPFLYNLFSDQAIIRLPAPLRLPLAALIASRRAPTARQIYAQLGGASPLLANTRGAGARARSANSAPDHRCFIAMRYWHPLTAAAVSEVEAMGARRDRAAAALPAILDDDDAILARRLGARGDGGSASTCRPDASAPIPTRPALSRRSRPSTGDALDAARAEAHPIRLLLSAHGLPEKIVRAGDPYPREVATTAAALLRRSPAGIDARVLDLTRSAIRAGSARSPGSDPRSRRNCGGPAATGSALSSCRSRLSRSIRRRWSNSIASTADVAEQMRRPVLPPGADRRRRSPVHRRAGRSGPRRRLAAPRCGRNPARERR